MPLMREPQFGPEAKVFQALEYNPCSIMLRDVKEVSSVRIQVRTDRSDWKDYEEGDLIVGKTVLCRLTATVDAAPNSVKVEVFRS